MSTRGTLNCNWSTNPSNNKLEDTMTTMFLYGCGISLMIGVGLVFYARAIQREKEYGYRTSWLEGRINDAIDKSDKNVSHYSLEEAWWDATK